MTKNLAVYTRGLSLSLFPDPYLHYQSEILCRYSVQRDLFSFDLLSICENSMVFWISMRLWEM